MQFKGTKNYIATEDLSMAVNASMALERPLLIKGEPGTGKTAIAEGFAKRIVDGDLVDLEDTNVDAQQDAATVNNEIPG